MTALKKYTVQVKVGKDWANYSLCTTLQQAIELSVEELAGYSFRILGLHDGHWIECLVSGTMLSVEHKDFRHLTA